jgi:hypothetical protein
MSPKEVVRLAKSLAGKSEKDIGEALRRQHLDATERLSVKLEIKAQAAQRKLSASLATDGAQWRQERPLQPQTEIERLLSRIGIELGSARQYTEAEMDEMLRHAGVTDSTQRIALKCEAEARGLLLPPRAPADSRRLDGMRASAERPRGKVLLNADGTPRTLRFS